VSGTTGSAGKPVGDGLGNAGTNVEKGVGDVSQKTKDTGEWKK
jgi:ribosomal protein L11